MPRRHLPQLCAAALVGSVLFVPATALAAQPAPSGLTMSPPLQQISIGSGLVEAHSELTLTNHTDHPVAVTLKPVDLGSLGIAGGFGFDQAGSASLSKYGLSNWMKLPAGNQATIAAGATDKLPVYIENRADLAPGGHYGAIVVGTDDTQSGAGKVGVTQELVSLVFVAKLDGAHAGLSLTSVTPSGNHLLPSSVRLRFRGTGNVDSVPRGLVHLTDSRGKLLASFGRWLPVSIGLILAVIVAGATFGIRRLRRPLSTPASRRQHR